MRRVPRNPYATGGLGAAAGQFRPERSCGHGPPATRRARRGGHVHHEPHIPGAPPGVPGGRDAAAGQERAVLRAAARAAAARHAGGAGPGGWVAAGEGGRHGGQAGRDGAGEAAGNRGNRDGPTRGWSGMGQGGAGRWREVAGKAGVQGLDSQAALPGACVRARFAGCPPPPRQRQDAGGLCAVRLHAARSLQAAPLHKRTGAQEGRRGGASRMHAAPCVNYRHARAVCGEQQGRGLHQARHGTMTHGR